MVKCCEAENTQPSWGRQTASRQKNNMILSLTGSKKYVRRERIGVTEYMRHFMIVQENFEEIASYEVLAEPE